MRRAIQRWIPGSLALLLAAAPLLAEETSGEKEANRPAAARNGESDEYVEVNLSYVPTLNTIATRLPVPLIHTPFNIGTVSRTLFEEQNAITLDDALQNVSGINPLGGTGVHDFFTIRGFDSLNGSLLLTDGAPEPEVTYYPLYNVQGVEVLKGPAGFLYGSNPLAGAVNMVRKQPLPTNFGQVSAQIGSYDTANASVDWNHATPDGDLSFRLNAFYYRSDRYRDDQEARHAGINPGFAWKINEKSKLNFNIEYVDAGLSPDSGLPLIDFNTTIPDVPRTRSYQSPFDFSDQQVGRFQVDYENRMSEMVTLRNKTYFRSLDWDTAGTQFPCAVFDLSRPDDCTTTPNPFSPTTVSRLVIDLDDEQRTIGNQFEAVLELGHGSVKHRLLAGLELSRMTDDFVIGFGGIDGIDLYDPVETATSITPFGALLDDTETTVIAPYVIDQIEFSEKIQLLLGVRYDEIRFDSAARGERNDGEASPMLGLVYSPQETLSLYMNAGRSFAPPSPRVVETIPGPEESRQIELGAKKGFMAGKIRTTFSLYQIERENIAIPDDNGVTQQLGNQRSRGFEVEFSAEPGNRLHTFLAYAYNDSELTEFAERVSWALNPDVFVVVDRSGNTPAFAPEHLVNFWISKTFAGGFGVGGGGRYFSDQYISEANTFQIDGALVLDATVFYNFKSYRISLNLKNLTNQEYESRGFGSTSVIPADGFNAYVGFDFRF